MKTEPNTHGHGAARRLLPLAMAALTWAGAATAGSLGYTPGGLPDLTGFREGSATFDDVAQRLGTPEQLDTNTHNQVSS